MEANYHLGLSIIYAINGIGSSLYNQLWSLIDKLTRHLIKSANIDARPYDRIEL